MTNANYRRGYDAERALLSLLAERCPVPGECPALMGEDTDPLAVIADEVAAARRAP